jgi:hypothetical protein
MSAMPKADIVEVLLGLTVGIALLAQAFDNQRKSVSDPTRQYITVLCELRHTEDPQRCHNANAVFIRP